MLKSVNKILKKAHKPGSHIRSTELFNEGWMLRIVLDWFSNHFVEDKNPDHLFRFHQGATWYSEVLLPTHFKRRTMSGDKEAESRTHADGVVGHFQIEEKPKQDFSLRKGLLSSLTNSGKLGAE